MKSIQEVSKETLKIENILSTASLGQLFTYNQLEDLTGVKMNNQGKAFMRSAFNRLKLEYEVIRGKGIKIISAENATKIVVSRVIKIDNSIRRAEKTTKRVRAKVYNELSEPEQKNINFLSALFGTIRSYSVSAKRIFSQQPLRVGDKVS